MGGLLLVAMVIVPAILLSVREWHPLQGHHTEMFSSGKLICGAEHMVPSLKANSLGSQALSKPSTGLLSSHLGYMCVGPEHTQTGLRLERKAATCC